MEKIGDVQLHIADPVDLNAHFEQSTLFAQPRHGRRLTVIVQRQVPAAFRQSRLAEHFRLEAVVAIQGLFREVLRVDDAIVFVVRLILGDLRFGPPIFGHVQKLKMIAGQSISIPSVLFHYRCLVRVEWSDVVLRETLK